MPDLHFESGKVANVPWKSLDGLNARGTPCQGDIAIEGILGEKVRNSAVSCVLHALAHRVTRLSSP